MRPPQRITELEEEFGVRIIALDMMKFMAEDQLQLFLRIFFFRQISDFMFFLIPTVSGVLTGWKTSA